MIGGDLEKDVCEKTQEGGAFILDLAFCLRARGESICICIHCNNNNNTNFNNDDDDSNS